MIELPILHTGGDGPLIKLPSFDDLAYANVDAYNRTIAINPDIEALIAADAPIAFGLSGGKDGQAAASITTAYLDQVGHKGPRVALHSDLGKIEWRTSRLNCERQAELLNLELIVVKPLRDMVDRWRYRWECNIARYADLLCVKLIMPFSSSGMRFCTTDKIAPISTMLLNRFPGKHIISVTGIRRQESSRRATAPTSKYEKKFYRARARDGSRPATRGVSYHPILHWLEHAVYQHIFERGLPLHEAYTQWKMKRVSCCLCILMGREAILNSLENPEHHPVYRELVSLEVQSTFSFQSDDKWLADARPDLLDSRTRAFVAEAKERAKRREAIEATIPKHLLYTKHWPTVIPTPQEADLLARVRMEVADAVGIEISYTDPELIIERYNELMALKEQRRRKKARKSRNSGQPELMAGMDELLINAPAGPVQATLW